MRESEKKMIKIQCSSCGNIIEIPKGYAGFWKRFWACFMDHTIIVFPLAVMTSVTDWETKPDVYLILIHILRWLYYAVLESSPTQATVGKIALGIKVTDMAGKRITFWQATGRQMCKLLSEIIFGLGYLMVAFTKKKQGLHDMIAGCLVVNN